jgi:hypothetical protein
LGNFGRHSHEHCELLHQSRPKGIENSLTN